MKRVQPLFSIILAAGKGTRMKSDMAKVLHHVFFSPMIHHVLAAVAELRPKKSIVVVGHQKEAVKQALHSYTVEFVEQEKQLGTGHAVLCAEQAIDEEDGVIMVLCGDTPLIAPETLKAMYYQHLSRNAVCTIMSTILPDPSNYGRILTDRSGRLAAIVEEKDASAEERKISEINAGIYCVNSRFLFDTLKNVGMNNSQGEMYLTDIVSLAVAKGFVVEKFVNSRAIDVLGVNSRVELAQAHKEMLRRRNQKLMLQGVTLYDPDATAIANTVSVGRDSILHRGVRISGNSTIGSFCMIEDGTILHDCQIADHVHIGAYSYLEGVTCARGATLPPHSIQRMA